MRLATNLGASLVGLLLLLVGSPAHATTQRITLQPGWNLISFAITPDNPSVSVVLAPLVATNNLEALWSYNATSGIWRRFPAAVAGGPTITAIQDGKGYWLKVRNAAALDVNGQISSATGPTDLAQDWNLVGFSLDEPRPYDRVITNSAIRQIWTFDAVQGKFIGVVFDANGIVVSEGFVNLEPGRGYWLFSNQAVSLAPILATSLPSDLDVPPLLGTDSTTTAMPFSPLTAGDIDIGKDGFYDNAATQRAIDFGERLNIQPISIFNNGSGVLNWRISIVDPEATPWLHFRMVDPNTQMQTLVTELSGSVASETTLVDIVVDRAGLAPGSFDGTVSVTTNAADMPPPAEPNRTIAVHMTVADLDGDYQLTAQIKTVNDKVADLPDPRLNISLYHDRDGFKVAINEATSLLISQRLRMSGALVLAHTSRFEVSGSYEMAAGDSGNPFGVAIRRDLTLRGQRRDPLNPDDNLLGPLDLKGEYFETIRNVTAQPIYLAGTFVATRAGSVPSARDEDNPKKTTAASIPENQPLEQTITVTRKILITDLAVTVNISHPRPADLVVTLIGPDATAAVLRRNSAAPVGSVTYADQATPVDSLEVFNGKLAPGVYTLRVADTQPGQTGSLLNWSLRIRGTEVHDVGGSIAGVPQGTLLVLSGCGVTSLATTGAAGIFSFKNLVDCVYRVRVVQSGFHTASTDVVLSGSDIGNVSITPGAADPFMPSPVTLPHSSNAAFVSLTTSGGAGALEPATALQSVFDATTYDVDRPPLGNFPGPEDTDAFLHEVDPLTQSNVDGRVPGNNTSNLQLDGPVGPNSRRITIAIGLPVMGTSTQGEMQLSVGANP